MRDAVEEPLLAPQSLESFQARLSLIGENMPKRLQQCRFYIEANLDKIAVSTIAQIANKAGVQPSALMRFCKLMGFSGFSDMQRLFRDQYTHIYPDYATRIENLKQKGADHPAGLLAEFVIAGQKSLENLLHSVNQDSLEEAARQLADADAIHIIGTRRAFPVAAYFAYAFEKMQIPAILHSGLANLDYRHSLRKQDALLAITFQPYSNETIDLAEYANSLGVKLVLITDSLNSRLSALNLTPLYVSEYDVGAFRALSATFTLALSLAVSVGIQKECALKLTP